MNNQPSDLIKKLMENPESITPEQMEKLLQDSLKIFSFLPDVLNTDNKEQQEKALKNLEEYSLILQELSKKALEKAGLSSEEIAKAIQNNSLPQFLEGQKKSVSEIGKTMSVFNSSRIGKSSSPTEQKTLEKIDFPKKA